MSLQWFSFEDTSGRGISTPGLTKKNWGLNEDALTECITLEQQRRYQMAFTIYVVESFYCCIWNRQNSHHCGKWLAVEYSYSSDAHQGLLYVDMDDSQTKWMTPHDLRCPRRRSARLPYPSRPLQLGYRLVSWPIHAKLLKGWRWSQR